MIMKDIKQIKEELTDFNIKYNIRDYGLEVIKGNTLTELFKNISNRINWCKSSPSKKKEFTAIFDNELVIEDGVLLCNCTNLTTVNIPESVTSIGESAFYRSIELTSVIIPNSVTSIGKYAFVRCEGLTSITIPNSITSISDGVFFDCIELTSVTIPESVKSIGRYAFAYCNKLTSIIIPNSVTSIGDYAFYECRKNLKIIRK